MCKRVRCDHSLSHSKLQRSIYLFSTLQHVGSDVTLSTVYPKRTFTTDDLAQTLLSLNLAPSAVLIAVPVCQHLFSLDHMKKGITFVIKFFKDRKKCLSVSIFYRWCYLKLVIFIVLSDILKCTTGF